MEINQKLIDQFHKNSVEIVKVHFQEWKGQSYFDIRVWRSDNLGENRAERPTTKGITLNIDLLADLVRASEEVGEVFEKRPERLVERRSQEE